MQNSIATPEVKAPFDVNKIRLDFPVLQTKAY